MPPSLLTNDYPIAIFIHGHYSSPERLQATIQTPTPPKLRKARLVGYAASADSKSSAVTYDGRNFGTWDDEDNVKGVVYMLTSPEEEQKLRLVSGLREIGP